LNHPFIVGEVWEGFFWESGKGVWVLELGLGLEVAG